MSAITECVKTYWRNVHKQFLLRSDPEKHAKTLDAVRLCGRRQGVRTCHSLSAVGCLTDSCSGRILADKLRGFSVRIQVSPSKTQWPCLTQTMQARHKLVGQIQMIRKVHRTDVWMWAWGRQRRNSSAWSGEVLTWVMDQMPICFGTHLIV